METGSGKVAKPPKTRVIPGVEFRPSKNLLRRVQEGIVDMVTKDEAKSMILVERGKVHTLLDSGPVVLGADWSEKSIMEAIDGSYMCKRTGVHAQTIGHGLVIVPTEGCARSAFVFVRTKPIASTV